MTKKDFILFAEMFKRRVLELHMNYYYTTHHLPSPHRPSSWQTIDEKIQWAEIVDDFCSVCYTIDNDFNSEKFKQACGYYD